MAATAPAIAPIPLLREGGSADVLYSGAGDHILSAAATAGVSGMLTLVPCDTACEAAAAAAAGGKGITVRHVSVDAPAGLSATVADACVAALSSLPRPVLVACATGNRASAVIAIAAGRAGKWSGVATLEWAIALKMPFINMQPLRNWVVVRGCVGWRRGGTRKSHCARACACTPSSPPPPPHTHHRDQLAQASVDPAPQPSLARAFNGVIFRQLFEPLSSTFTYVLGDPSSGEAVLIDPVLGKVDRDISILNDLGLTAVWAINTHVHADHVSGSFALRVKVPGCRSALAAASGAAADACLAEGDTIAFGARSLRVIATPGHTNGCLSFVLDTGLVVFSGDALLIRGCGRTDFQGGSSSILFSSVREKLFALPDDALLFPGHDYNGASVSSIGEERRFNARLGAARSAADFESIMAALNLPQPALIDVAVPANMWDGDAARAAAAAAPVMEAGAGLPTPCKRCYDAVQEGIESAVALVPCRHTSVVAAAAAAAAAVV